VSPARLHVSDATVAEFAVDIQPLESAGHSVRGRDLYPPVKAEPVRDHVRAQDVHSADPLSVCFHVP
jgi:hypothetical protein